MQIERKLLQWQRAGLLDAEACARIREFESSRRNPVLLYALAWLGAATVGIGAISVVAANWQGFSDFQKLAAAGAVGTALAAGIVRTRSASRLVLSEALVCIDYLYVAATIGLIGQIYQSGTPAWQALLFWSVVTLPLMLLARTPLAGGLWFTGLLVTYGFVSVAAIESLSSDSWPDGVAVATALWPFLVVASASLPWLREHRPAVASAFVSGSAFLGIFAGLTTPFVFYARLSMSEHLSWSIPVVALLFAGIHVLLPRVLPSASPRARLGVTLSLACLWLTLALGTTFERGELDPVGAGLQILFLGTLAWTMVQMGRLGAFNFLTGLIALRVLIIYFEVFGSMLSTGVGMITGGTLTLIMAWEWKKRSPRLARQLAAHGGSEHVA